METQTDQADATLLPGYNIPLNDLGNSTTAGGRFQNALIGLGNDVYRKVQFFTGLKTGD